MNQSDLRVDGLPNVAAVWVDYFLLVIVKRQQTVSDPIKKMENAVGILVLTWNIVNRLLTMLEKLIANSDSADTIGSLDIKPPQSD